MLPDLLHDSLSVADRARVEAHVSTCSACAGELALLRRVQELHVAPAVNVQVIAASIGSYRRRSRFAMQPLMRIAAVIAVMAVGGVSYSVITRSNMGTAGLPESLVVQGRDSALPAASYVDASEIAELTTALDEDVISQLIAEIQNVDVELPTEPRKIVRLPGGDD
jgi:hypothetical protein